MRSHARVVIIGGGSLGINLLYHLTKAGWTDIALVEKGELTSGSTWHAAGLCSNFIGNMTVAKIHDYSIKLYSEIIPAETGEASTFHRTGSLRLGYTPLEEEWFRHLESRAKNIGCAFHLISQDEAKRVNPFMDFSGARVIAHTPNDGHVDPTSVVMPLAQLAKKNGAEINRFTQVTAIHPRPSGEWEVVTDHGSIIAEHVVNAAGCFAPQVAAMVGVSLPIINLEHQYLVTEEHPELAKLGFELPVCRDSSASSYIRQEGKGLLVGPYETYGSKPWALDGIDWSFDRGLFPPDLERLMPFLERCMELVPIFRDVGVKTVINGAITHTPDDNMLAGPQAGLRHFWNLCGSSIGIAQGGVGKFMAQWITTGQTEINMAPLDSRRFGAWANRNYCIIKAIESYETMYTATGVNENRPHGRPLITSPVYTTLQQKGGVHKVTRGYEQPAWFQTAAVRHDPPTWSRSATHRAVAEECLAVMQTAGVMDLSASAKFEIIGSGATAYLEHLSANKLPSKDGRLGLTLCHAPQGGIMCEFSVTRLTPEHYYLVSGIGSELKDLQWLQWHASGFDVQIRNVSADWGILLLTGPNARAILQALTNSDLGNAAFPWLSAQTIRVDSASVRVIRVSYAGELGYELHLPLYQMLSIYQSMERVGAAYGLRDFGGYALNSLRLEKAYRAYGSELTEEISGLEAGLGRFIDLSRDFIGADNLRQRQQQGLVMQLALLAFDDDIPCECFGNEAVYLGTERVGLTTSGAYGHRVGYSLAFAYLPPALLQSGTRVEVLTTLGKRTAHVELNAVYDANNQRLRS